MLEPILSPFLTSGTAGARIYLLILSEQEGLVSLLLPAENAPDLAQLQVIRGEYSSRDALKETRLMTHAPSRWTHATLLPLAEDALKHLWDLNFLSDHPLTRLHLVQARCRMANEPITRLDRAKALSILLSDLIAKLKPDGALPSKHEIPKREWHSYLVLYCAYIEGDHNFEIMNWLHIGEGTFNRTRRKALQAVANVLIELEDLTF